MASRQTRYDLLKRRPQYNHLPSKGSYHGLGSQSYAGHTLQCSYLPASKWGYLEEDSLRKHAWLLRLQLIFPQFRLENAMVQLKFRPEPEPRTKTAAPPPTGVVDSPPHHSGCPEITSYFQPDKFHGDNVFTLVTSYRDAKPSFSLKILGGGGNISGIGGGKKETYGQIHPIYDMFGGAFSGADGTMTRLEWTMTDTSVSVKQQTAPRRCHMFAAAIVTHHLKPFLIDINVSLGTRLPSPPIPIFRWRSSYCRPIRVVPVEEEFSLADSAANLEMEIAQKNAKPVAEALASEGVKGAQKLLLALVQALQAGEGQGGTGNEPADEPADEPAGEDAEEDDNDAA